MSVIFGRIHTDGRPINSDHLDVMQKSLNHWNADAIGIWNQNCVGLGHLMLFNTPESLNEKLPAYRSEGEIAITADARIDNREDLYIQLRLSTLAERNVPDSVLIAMLYEKYGTDCVKHLVGDFAFAIWDETKQQLFCARDHMGVKPFFYYHDARMFLFASEKKGILAVEGVDKQINMQFLYNQTFWPPQQGRDTTLYQHIHRLAPAHTLLYDNHSKKVTLSRYWTLDAETQINYKDKLQYQEELKHLLEQAVKCRLRTSFTLGGELSGGLDSSGIIGIASKHTVNKDGLITISTTHRPEETDPKILATSERRYIEDVVRFNKIKNPVYITDNAWDDPIEKVRISTFVNDGIEMWDTQLLLSVHPAARDNNIRVLLSGFPGDELVTYKGREQFLDAWETGQYLRYFTAMRGKRDLLKRLLPFVPHPLVVSALRANNAMRFITERISRKHFFDIPFRHRLRVNEDLWLDEHFSRRFTNFRSFLKAKILKPQVSLRMESETRYGIFYRLEPRFPMADIRLTQFYLSIPNGLKYEGNMPRYLYRNAVREYLPQSVYLRREKTGNMAPFALAPAFIEKNLVYVRQLVSDLRHEKTILKIKDEHMPFFYLDLLYWLKNNG